MKVFYNVKSIELKVLFEGEGCVNYDSPECQTFLGNRFTNRKVTKKAFKWGKNENNETVFYFKNKVSSECLRHELFKNEIEFANPNNSLIEPAYLKSITKPAMILKGYLTTAEYSTKLSSNISLGDALDVQDYIEYNRKNVMYEVHTQSGEKTENSLYYVEMCPNTDYESHGFIHLDRLQFLSCDVLYDRPSVLLDGGTEEQIYLDEMRQRYGDDISFKYYYKKNSITEDEWAERGILFSRDAVDMLTKDGLERVMDIYIKRKGAFLKFKKMDVIVHHLDENGELVSEPIKIESKKDLKNYYFSYFQEYNEANEEKILKNKELAEQIKNEMKAEKSSKKSKNSKKEKNDTAEDGQTEKTE